MRFNFDNLKTFDACGYLRDNTRSYLQHNDVRQKELAEHLGVSEQTICDFLAGRRNLRSDTFGRLALLVNNPFHLEKSVRAAFGKSKNAKIVHLQENGGPKKSLEAPTIPFAEFMAKTKPNKRMHI